MVGKVEILLELVHDDSGRYLSTWKSVLLILNDSFMVKMNRRNLDLKPHNFCQKVLVRAAN